MRVSSIRRLRPRYVVLAATATLVVIYRNWIYCMGIIANCFITWNLKPVNFIGTKNDGLPRDLDGLDPPPPDVDLAYLAIARRVLAGEKVDEVVKELKEEAQAVELEVEVQEKAARAAAVEAGVTDLPPLTPSTEPRLSQLIELDKLPFTLASVQTYIRTSEQALDWGPPLQESDLIIPPILHHIAIGMKTEPPKQWMQAVNACSVVHPHWQRMYWDDAAAEKFIKAEHSWFWDTWTNYRFNIQKADSLRYLVLYTYGGTYLDMDLMCRRSLDPLRKFPFLANAAHPIGVSNGFIMVPAKSPFIANVIDNLQLFNQYFISPYASVMFSTGCTYISALHNIFPQRDELKVLGGQRNRLSGKVNTPLFRHLGASSWHQGDAKMFVKLGKWLKKVPIFGTEKKKQISDAPALPASEQVLPHEAASPNVPGSSPVQPPVPFSPQPPPSNHHPHHSLPPHTEPANSDSVPLQPIIFISFALIAFLALLKFRYLRRQRRVATYPGKQYTSLPSSPATSATVSLAPSTPPSPLPAQKSAWLMNQKNKRQRHRREDSDASDTTVTSRDSMCDCRGYPCSGECGTKEAKLVERGTKPEHVVVLVREKDGPWADL